MKFARFQLDSPNDRFAIVRTNYACLLAWHLVFFLGEKTLPRPLCNTSLGAKRFAFAPGRHAVLKTYYDSTHVFGAKLFEICVPYFLQ